MRIAILGGPGCGKGTQARLLSGRYDVPHVSTGDLLRAAAEDKERLDADTRAAMEAGQLAPDPLVLELLEERLRKRDAKRGFIIDGFPRNIPQAQSLDTLLGMLGWSLEIVIYMEMDDKIMVKRITGRLGCTQCGAIYNRHLCPPARAGVCDQCRAKLIARRDDNARAAAVRIPVYHEKTAPLLNYYKVQHKLRTVVAVGDIEEIQQKIRSLVDLETRPLEINTAETTAAPGEEITTVIAGGRINRVTPPPPAAPAVDPAATKENNKENNVAEQPPAPAQTAVKARVARKKPAAKPATGNSTKKPPATDAKGAADKAKTVEKTAAALAALADPGKKKTAPKTIAKKPSTPSGKAPHVHTESPLEENNTVGCTKAPAVQKSKKPLTGQASPDRKATGPATAPDEREAALPDTPPNVANQTPKGPPDKALTRR